MNTEGIKLIVYWPGRKKGILRLKITHIKSGWDWEAAKGHPRSSSQITFDMIALIGIRLKLLVET